MNFEPVLKEAVVFFGNWNIWTIRYGTYPWAFDKEGMTLICHFCWALYPIVMINNILLLYKLEWVTRSSLTEKMYVYTVKNISFTCEYNDER